MNKGGGKRIQIFKSFFEVVTEFTFTFFHKENQNFLNYVIEPICKKKTKFGLKGNCLQENSWTNI